MRAAASLRVGQHLGPYRIEGLLGCGGMGRVYLARARGPERTVAIKVVDPARQQGAALLREARFAATLDHPAICSVHEVGHVGSDPFIVMEHVRGASLATIIRARRGLPLDASVDYARQIGDAVAHAHERGIVHGDLKSSNVMVDANGRVKVLDFGLAVRRAMASASDADLDTTCPSPSSGCAGTVPYMSPDLLRGRPPNEQSDFWAFGVLLYEMLAGRRPFHGITTYELAARILAHEREPMSPRVPDSLRPVIDRCLCPAPAGRYRAALDLVADLARVVTAHCQGPRDDE